MVYSTYLGGSNGERGAAIHVDEESNAHVAGYTISNNFPTADPVQSSSGGGTDAFVAKLNTTGTGLVYSTYLGGSGSDVIGEIGGNEDGDPLALDDDGNAYVTGRTTSTNFPVLNPFQPTNAGEEDAFVVKLLAEGNLWGDWDCDGSITTRDNQALLRKVLQQNPLGQTEPCPDIEAAVNVAGFGERLWGDSDCDGMITTRDNQALLRKVLQQNPLGQTEPCPDLGAVIEV
jgi:hypothetical protein